MSADPLGFTGRVLCAGNTVAILYQAHKQLAAGTPMPTLMADDGVENFNAQVDELVEKKVLYRVLAQTDVLASNSMIEAWWRSLKHNWLFLNTLDTFSRLRSLVEFYVKEHNSNGKRSGGVVPRPRIRFKNTWRASPTVLAAPSSARRSKSCGRSCASFEAA